MVKPAGTRSAPSTRVISATLAPLPPSSSRMSRDPSAKSYTHFESIGPWILPHPPDRSSAREPQVRQPDAGVVLGRLAHGTVGLRERGGLRDRGLRERAAERLDQ